MEFSSHRFVELHRTMDVQLNRQGGRTMSLDICSAVDGHVLPPPRSTRSPWVTRSPGHSKAEAPAFSKASVKSEGLGVHTAPNTGFTWCHQTRAVVETKALSG